MSVADSVYNLQLIRAFCQSSLQSCCPLAVEDLLYAPPLLHVSALDSGPSGAAWLGPLKADLCLPQLNIMSFVSELLQWFEMKKPEFVQPVQSVDLTGPGAPTSSGFSAFIDC